MINVCWILRLPLAGPRSTSPRYPSKFECASQNLVFQRVLSIYFCVGLCGFAGTIFWYVCVCVPGTSNLAAEADYDVKFAGLV